jgi:hypothetical protein
MTVNVRIEHLDKIAVVEQGDRAEEKQGYLFVYDKDGGVAAKFTVSEVRHWWIGSSKEEF